jgi:hypothetical protein
MLQLIPSLRCRRETTPVEDANGHTRRHDMRTLTLTTARRPEPEVDPYATAPYIAAAPGPKGSTIYVGPAGLLLAAAGIRVQPGEFIDYTPGIAYPFRRLFDFTRYTQRIGNVAGV